MAVVRKLNSSQAAVLEIDGQAVELPVFRGTEGETCVDISKLRAATGVVTMDNGFMNTSACTSEITFLDGENGILHYRGYPIEQLAEKATFMEVAHLLIYGDLPSRDQLVWFNEKVAAHYKTKKELKAFVQAFPKTAHPMGVLSSAIAAMSAYHPEFTDPYLNGDQQDEVIAQLLAQVKNLSAYFYRISLGKELVDSNPHRFDYCGDFLNMMFNDGGTKGVDAEVARALNVLLILHADHEQNCSTSTVRLVGSSRANLYASISAGVNALWGPLHGGANQAVIEMLEEIHAAGGDYRKFLQRAKDKNDTFRLMGFGHRVYKNFDPRAKIIKHECDKVLRKMGVKNPLLDIAKGLEEEALKDQYFVERKLYPNVDFYSGIIYKALNIPTNMFTVMFALGRMPGWLAQWREMINDKETKIGRPRQIYTGQKKRNFVDIEKR